MGRQHLSPKSFGKAAAAWNDEFLRIRVNNETDPERLRAAIEHEIERHGDTRRERIGLLNERLQAIEE